MRRNVLDVLPSRPRDDRVLSRGASQRKVSQMTASLNCWIANSSGIAANGISRGRLADFSVSVPRPRRTAPAEKLAVSEKHT